jgi:hypothetical protein
MQIILAVVGLLVCGAASAQTCTTYTVGDRTYTNCTNGDGSTTTCTTYWVGDRRYTNC